MTTFYYKFTNDILEETHEQSIKEYIEPSWSKVSSCPFKKIPSMVTKSFTGVVDLYNKTKENMFSGISDRNEMFFNRTPTTIRTCPGVNNILKQSIMIKTPCDIHISIKDGDFIANYSSTDLVLDITCDHGIDQYTTTDGDNLFGNFIDLKFKFPIRWKSDKELIFLHPHFHDNLPFTIVNGAFNKNYPTNMNIIALFPVTNKVENYYIKKGTVIAYLWSTEKIKIKHKKNIGFSFPGRFIGNS